MSDEASATTFSLQAIRVGGPDAGAFLQSQLTCDVESLKAGRFAPAAWCTPDGRAEAVMLIASVAGGYDLALPAPIAGDVVKRLSMFRIGRNVEIDTARAAIPARPGADGAMELAGDPDRALAVVDAPQAPVTLPREWIERDIDTGQPWILPPTRGRFLPQMLGLDALGGLSYRKGCFPGQEVIARVHYRGRVTRKTVRFRASGGAPAPGTELRLDFGVATVLYAIPEGDNQSDPHCGLAVVPSDAVGDASFDYETGTGTVVE